jgi:hypothetical protein
MRTVHKYGLTNYMTQLTLQAPKFLHVGLQNGVPQLWVEVDVSKSPTENYRIEAVGTGFNVPKDGQHLSTVLLDNDSLVLHFYAVKV